MIEKKGDHYNSTLLTYSISPESMPSRRQGAGYMKRLAFKALIFNFHFLRFLPSGEITLSTNPIAYFMTKIMFTYDVHPINKRQVSRSLRKQKSVTNEKIGPKL